MGSMSLARDGCRSVLSAIFLFSGAFWLSAACFPVPDGAVSWWTGDGTAEDLLGRNHATLQNGTSFAIGKVGQGFLLDGADDFVLVPDSASLDLANELTIELWYKSDRASGGEPLFDKRSGGGPCNYGAILSSTYGIEVYYNDPAVNDGDFPGSGFEISATPPPVPEVDVFHHFASTFRQASSNQLELRTFLNGALLRTSVIQGSLARAINDAPLSIGTEGAGAGAKFKGIIDEVTLYSRALTTGEINAIYLAGSGGKCYTNTPPTPPTNEIALMARHRGVFHWPFDKAMPMTDHPVRTTG